MKVQLFNLTHQESSGPLDLSPRPLNKHAPGNSICTSIWTLHNLPLLNFRIIGKNRQAQYTIMKNTHFFFVIFFLPIYTKNAPGYMKIWAIRAFIVELQFRFHLHCRNCNFDSICKCGITISIPLILSKLQFRFRNCNFDSIYKSGIAISIPELQFRFLQ